MNAMTTPPLDLQALIRDVFNPQPGESVLVMTDTPTPAFTDYPDWAERRVMAENWRQAFAAYGQAVRPLLTFPATGGNNADLPENGLSDGAEVRIADEIAGVDMVVAMTTFSATAPLSAYVKNQSRLRVASMPDAVLTSSSSLNIWRRRPRASRRG